MQYKEQIDLSRIPQHVAIIMDGNGRWAKQRGHERSYGHQVGAETVHVIAFVRLLPPACVWASPRFRPMRFLPKTGTARQMKWQP